MYRTIDHEADSGPGPPAGQGQGDHPLVSVIIPLQEHDCFEATLEALLHQQGLAFSDYEVIVVDGLHLHDWPGVMAALAAANPECQLTYIRIAPSRSRARQLNVGLREAKGQLVLLLADDFIPSEGLVASHLAAHREQPAQELVAIGPGMFSGKARSSEFMSWLEDSGELFGVSFSDPDLRLPGHFFYMANTSLKRSFLTKAGEFDEDFPFDAVDDWEMGLRLVALGMRNHYLPQAVATHEHIVDLPERCIHMRRAGESSAIYDAKHLQPGPWSDMLDPSRQSPRRRRRESREQRYRRILEGHWKEGYRHGLLKLGPSIAAGR